MWANWPMWAQQVLGGEWLVLWFMFIYWLDGFLRGY